MPVTPLPAGSMAQSCQLPSGLLPHPCFWRPVLHQTEQGLENYVHHVCILLEILQECPKYNRTKLCTLTLIGRAHTGPALPCPTSPTVVNTGHPADRAFPWVC